MFKIFFLFLFITLLSIIVSIFFYLENNDTLNEEGSYLNTHHEKIIFDCVK